MLEWWWLGVRVARLVVVVGDLGVDGGTGWVVAQRMWSFEVRSVDR